MKFVTLSALTIWISVTAATPHAFSSHIQYFGYYRDSDIGNHICEIQDHANFSMTADGLYEEEALYGISDWGVSGYSPLGAYNFKDDADVQQEGWAAVKAEIERQIPGFMNSHPNGHPYINLAGHFRNIPGFSLPRGLDWVGLECYFGVADCQSMVNALRRVLPGNGRIWILIPTNTWYGNEAWLVSNAQAMYSGRSPAADHRHHGVSGRRA